MLFDLRSRGRRRTVQVIYLGLAILIGGGLILFGVGTGTGGGGLLNSFTGNGSNSGQTQAIDQQTRSALKATRLHPNSASAWAQLLQAYWSAANSTTSGSSSAAVAADRRALVKATDAWGRYVSLTKSPDPGLATIAGRAYVEQAKYAQATGAWQSVVQAEPSAASAYLCLALSAYAAKKDRIGDLAAAKTVSLAPKLQRLTLKQEITASKTQPAYAQENCGSPSAG